VKRCFLACCAWLFVCISACATIPEDQKDIVPALVELPGGSFIIIGDTGTGTPDQARVGDAMSGFCKRFDCRFGVLLGDNFYPSGVKSVSDSQWQSGFEKPYAQIPFKFFPVLGNHDYMGDIRAEIAYKSPRWSMPTRYFSGRYQDRLEIFFLDTEVLDKDPQQLKWFEQKLKASTAQWKIAAGHHPVYSGGTHGDTGSMKSKFLPLAKKYGLDFYLAGHDHDLQVIERDGLNFVISGAGAKLRDVKKVEGTIFAASKLGFAHFEMVDAKRAILRMVDAQNNILFDGIYEK
jgi:tartrate-resistant acid phosphatase type 5